MRKKFATLLLFALVISACGRKVRPEALPEELPPGRVWINTFRDGLTVLSSMGWRTFHEGTTVFDLALGPEGQLWAAHFDELVYFDGRTFVSPHESRRATVLDFDEQGRLWAGLGLGVGLFDGTEWTSFIFRDYGIEGTGATLFHDLTIDDQGQVWAATGAGLVVFDGQEWTVHPSPAHWGESIRALTLDDQGRLWAGHSGGVSVFNGSSWTAWTGDDMGLEGALSVNDIAFDDKGRAWMAVVSRGLLVFDGQTWERYDMSNSGLAGDVVKAVAIDVQGRVWTGTDCGVSVFDGKNWITYNQSNSGLVSNDVRQILIQEGGMAALPELQKVRVGKLRGSVVREGKPVAGARALLCTSVSGTIPGIGFGGETPCTGPFQRETVTDEGGSFTFSDVPIGWSLDKRNRADRAWFA